MIEKVLQIFIGKFIDAWDRDSFIEQQAWQNVIHIHAHRFGYGMAAVDIEDKLLLAKALVEVCRESGNVQMLDTANDLIDMYSILLDTLHGYSYVSVPALAV